MQKGCLIIPLLQFHIFLFNLLVKKKSKVKLHTVDKCIICTQPGETCLKKKVEQHVGIANKTYGGRKVGCSGIRALCI